MICFDIAGEIAGIMRKITTKGADSVKNKEVAKLVIKDGGRTTLVPQDQIEWIYAATSVSLFLRPGS